MTNRQKLIKCRKILGDHACDGLLLPVTDEYQGEYSADYARRVTWLTGFDGSAGMAVVLKDKAALLVDGRYTLQAANEVDEALYEVHDSSVMSLAAYIKAEMPKGALLAYDPWLHTLHHIETLTQALDDHVILRPVTPNVIDACWEDQPARPVAQVMRHDDALAGMSAREKIRQLCEMMVADALLLTEPDAICWLLNIRGADIPFNPLPLCYALVENTGSVQLIIHPDKVPDGALPDDVHVIDERAIEDYIHDLALASVQLAPAATPIWFVDQLVARGIEVVRQTNPVTLCKAIKNDTEIANMRKAHQVDGGAVTKFIHWFKALPETHIVTELDAIAQLEAFRCEHPDYLQPSFATIAGSGEHGAIVHYRADEKSNREIAVGEALLVDSGGQYAYGTTDITRTLVRGAATAEFKKHFTLVLKGHIALACAHFPKCTTGSQLDVLARQFLWAEGLDYKHGTGHGVGHYLCVHEGPQSISSRPNTVALQPGMILSNEPGYYKEGAYGIRIESLVLVVEKEVRDGQHFLGFETLTRAPIDEGLVDWALMSEQETQWLREYNEQVETI